MVDDMLKELTSKAESKVNEALQHAINEYEESQENVIVINQKKITDLWNGIINMLPTQTSRNKYGNFNFWTNGEEILCPSEETMETVYYFLNDIFNGFGNYTLITGWYNPDEDRESGEQDDCTGFNYIRLE